MAIRSLQDSIGQALCLGRQAFVNVEPSLGDARWNNDMAANADSPSCSLSSISDGNKRRPPKDRKCRPRSRSRIACVAWYPMRTTYSVTTHNAFVCYFCCTSFARPSGLTRGSNSLVPSSHTYPDPCRSLSSPCGSTKPLSIIKHHTLFWPSRAPLAKHASILPSDYSPHICRISRLGGHAMARQALPFWRHPGRRAGELTGRMPAHYRRH